MQTHGQCRHHRLGQRSNSTFAWGIAPGIEVLWNPAAWTTAIPVGDHDFYRALETSDLLIEFGDRFDPFAADDRDKISRTHSRLPGGGLGFHFDDSDAAIFVDRVCSTDQRR